MFKHNQRFCFSRIALATAVWALVSLHSHAKNNSGNNDGYLLGGNGNIVYSGSGECAKTGAWSPEKATVVGCDGVTLDTKIEIIEGKSSGILVDISLPAASLFAFDSAEFSDEGKSSVESLRKKLRPELTDSFAAIIVGHTDSSGNSKYNIDLSKRRAQSVYNYLVSSGAPAEKLRYIGMGEYDPIASNDTKEGRELNRRVEILVIAELRELDTMIFPSVALFDSWSAELTSKGKALIEKNRQQAIEQLKRASYIEIAGHTDSEGDEDRNLILSEARAESLRNYLVAQGVDDYKIVTIGFGESRPVATNKTPEGRADNRRVEVLVLGRLKR